MAMWQPRQVQAAAPLPRRDRRALQLVGAVAALLLVGGLVMRGSIGLTRPQDERIVTVDATTGQVTSGGVQLVPGTVETMFPEVHLDPGVPRAACIEITHDGTVQLDTVALRLAAAEGSSRLLAALHLRIERGAPGAAPDCTGFAPEAEVADGRLLELTEPPSPAGWSSWQPGRLETASYRFTVVLPPEEATDALQGARASVDFLWAATAQTRGAMVMPRVVMLAAAIARDAVLPLLLLAVLAVLFLGVQDRIDRRDPKLAMASVHEEPRAFRDAHPRQDRKDPARRVAARSRP